MKIFATNFVVNNNYKTFNFNSLLGLKIKYKISRKFL